MNGVRNWAVGPVIAAFILLSPIVAFLMALAAEASIDFAAGGRDSRRLHHRCRRYWVGSVSQVLAVS
jgi:hypothetical protein